MGPNGFISLPSPPSSPLSSLFFFPKTLKFQPNFKFFKTKAAMVSDKSFGFKSLNKICTVDVQRAEGRELNVPLIATFTIATSRLDKVENVAIRIELSNGCSGWGEMATASGLDLMIGGMVETRLGMSFAGHLSAGLGCFKFIDLNTPLPLTEDPVVLGYEVSGPVCKFTNVKGSGGFLRWDNIA